MTINFSFDITTAETIELANYAIDLAHKIGTELGSAIGGIAVMASQQSTTDAPTADPAPATKEDPSIEAVKAFIAGLNDEQLNAVHVLIHKERVKRVEQ